MQSSESPSNAMPTRANDIQSMSSAGRIPIEAASFGGSSFLGDGFGGADFEWGGGKSGIGMSSGPAGVDLGLQGVGTLVAGSELPDPLRANSYPTVFGDGRAVTVVDAASGQRIACWRTAETCILPPSAGSASAYISDQLVHDSVSRPAEVQRFLSDVAAVNNDLTQSQLRPLDVASTNSTSWLEDRRSMGAFMVANLYDSAMRGGYMKTIHAAADAAVDAFDELDYRDVDKAIPIAQGVSEGRDRTRTATQKKLTPWGRYLSENIEQKLTFDERVKIRTKTLTAQGSFLPPSEMQVLRGVAVGAGKSNGFVTGMTKASRVLGPIGAVAALGSSGYQIYKAAPGERGRVIAAEGGGMLGGLIGGAMGTAGSVWALTALAAAVPVLATAPVLLAGALVVGGYAAYKGGAFGNTWGDTSYRWAKGN